ncbi:MAG: 2Fe-2S iron-sulfur cluster-binding protein, partial [Nocardioidaceae bacterium]
QPPVRRTVTETAAAEGADVTITLDGRRSTFTLPAGGPPVLEAALAVRPDAPFACKGGVCGTCRARVVEGTLEMDTNWALEPDEVERGYVLTCQAHPTSPKVVLDYDG